MHALENPVEMDTNKEDIKNSTLVKDPGKQFTSTLPKLNL